MKKFSIILLLPSVVLTPIVRNGIGFLHYLSAHTHTFCDTDTDHEHPAADACLAMCHMDQHQGQQQLPTKVKFHELKQFVTPMLSLDIQSFASSYSAIDIGFLLHFGRIYANEVFHPPSSF